MNQHYYTIPEVIKELKVVTAHSIIPNITDKMGQHWKQPDRKHIFFYENDDRKCYMLLSTLKKLAEYSHPLPTGTYVGKMWSAYSRRTFTWYLRWYDEIEGEEITFKTREIVVIVNEPKL